MKETPQQYTQRVVSYLDGKQPLAVQAATAKKIDRLIKGVSPAKRRRPQSHSDCCSGSDCEARHRRG